MALRLVPTAPAHLRGNAPTIAPTIQPVPAGVAAAHASAPAPAHTPAFWPEKRRTQRRPAALMRELAERGTERRYRKGVLLIQEGEVCESLYIVLSGRLRAFASDPSGKEITLGLHASGDFVGETALDGGPCSVSVEAIEPSVCAIVPRETLTAFIAEHPPFALDLLAHVVRRARAATASARSFALLDVYGRLSRLLNELAEPQPDGNRRVPERMTHQQIADRVVCSREMISRLLKDLEAGGYVAQVERRLVLLRSLPARW
ncbi:MAG: Crp/Fnr family transcriptional regulator [Burkholderiales bacterium]